MTSSVLPLSCPVAVRVFPGFKAYVGYMHVEYTQTHPVVVVFLSLLHLPLIQGRPPADSPAFSNSLYVDSSYLAETGASWSDRRVWKHGTFSLRVAAVQTKGRAARNLSCMYVFAFCTHYACLSLFVHSTSWQKVGIFQVFSVDMFLCPAMTRSRHMLWIRRTDEMIYSASS